MKTKYLISILLISSLAFGCSESFEDLSPTEIQDSKSNFNLEVSDGLIPSGFNIPTNLTIIGTDNTGADIANMSFGVNPIMTKPLTITVEYQTRKESSDPFVNTFPLFTDFVIPAGSQFSNIEQFTLSLIDPCATSMELKVKVVQVKWGDIVIPETQWWDGNPSYYVLSSSNVDGTSKIKLNAPSALCDDEKPDHLKFIKKFIK